MKKPIVKSLFFGALFLLTTFAHAAPKPFQSEDCNLTDVKVDGSPAFDCRGSIEGNDSNDPIGINGIFGESGSLIIWDEAAKLNIEEGTGHDLSATSGSSGNWTYTGTDPLSSPFVVVLKASSEYSAYLFKGLEDLTNGDGGTFWISFLNKGDQTPALSHITIYSTTSDIPDISIFGNPVPLPAALWLFGPALLGFMGFRRKNKS